MGRELIIHSIKFGLILDFQEKKIPNLLYVFFSLQQFIIIWRGDLSIGISCSDRFFKQVKKHFWNDVYFQIVTVIIVSSSVLAVCERESHTGCQQAFSALARDSASHPYPNRSNMPTFVHCGVLFWCVQKHSFLYLQTPRVWGHVVIYVFSSTCLSFLFWRFLLFQGFQKRRKVFPFMSIYPHGFSKAFMSLLRIHCIHPKYSLLWSSFGWFLGHCSVCIMCCVSSRGFGTEKKTGIIVLSQTLESSVS